MARCRARPDWRWIHTPGHTPGHIALYRDRDKTLVSADAVITTKQESLTAVMAQRREMHGPPAYYTSDWNRARDSVRALAALAPECLVPGHGHPWAGAEMGRELTELARDFDRRERPRLGRYGAQPAMADESGVLMLPPDPLPAWLAGAGAMAAAAGLVWAMTSAQRRRHTAAS